MELIEPSLAYFPSYRSALQEFDEHNITGFWKMFSSPDDPVTYLRNFKLYEHQAGFESGMVPASVYWLVDGGEFIGHTSIRHRLNANLEKLGGHIGYAVRPSKHRQGYGSKILEFAIPKAQQLGITRALLTCNADNIASRRIIEKHGGKLIDQINVNGKEVLRFWIQL